MTILSRIEHLIDDALEATFAFRKKNFDLLDLNRMVRKQIELSKRKSLEKIYAPNNFEVVLSVNDYAENEALLDSLNAELRGAVLDAVESHGYELMGEVSITVRHDKNVKRGEVKIIASIKKDEPAKEQKTREPVEQTKKPQDEPMPLDKKEKPVSVPKAKSRELFGRLVSPENEDLIFSEQGDSIVIGRSKKCNLILNDDSISNQHARIDFDVNGARITDLKSTNGTWVNGEKIEKALLSHNDLIRLGETELRWSETHDLTAPKAKKMAAKGPNGLPPVFDSDIETTSEIPEQTEPDQETVSLKKSKPKKLLTAPWDLRKEEIAISLGKADDKDIVWRPEAGDENRLDNPHILIVGTTGSGKTQLVKSMLAQTRDKIGAIVLDFNDDYIAKEFCARSGAQVLDALQGINLNPLELPLEPDSGEPENPKLRLYEIASILRDCFRLGDQQHRLLKKAIQKVYQDAGFGLESNTWQAPFPQFNAIPEAVESSVTKTTAQISMALLNRIDPLFDLAIFSPKAERSFEELMRKTSIIRLSRLPGEELKQAAANFILQELYHRMIVLGQSTKLRVLVVVDEAHKLIAAEPLTRLIKESRKFGIGMVLASQEVTDFHRSFFANAGTKIIMKLPLAKDAHFVASQFGMPDEKARQLVRKILELNRFQAMIQNNHYKPFQAFEIKPFCQLDL